jgi:hypothetical protein
LSEQGVFYLLLIEENKPRALLEKFGFKYELLAEQRYHNENIMIFKLFK